MLNILRGIQNENELKLIEKEMNNTLNNKYLKIFVLLYNKYYTYIIH